MDREYWAAEWREGRVPWHGPSVHRDLVDFGPNFLQGGAHRVLLPLCGKTLDLAWLAARGHDVFGIEYVTQAVHSVFEEAGLDPVDEVVGPHAARRSGTLTVVDSDFFALDLEAIGQMDRVWDRDALVALDVSERVDYVNRILAMTRPGGQIMVNVFTYDTTKFDGPPYSISDVELKALFAGTRSVKLLRRDKTKIRQPIVLQHIEGTSTDTWLVEL